MTNTHTNTTVGQSATPTPETAVNMLGELKKGDTFELGKLGIQRISQLSKDGKSVLLHRVDNSNVFVTVSVDLLHEAEFLGNPYDSLVNKVYNCSKGQIDPQGNIWKARIDSIDPNGFVYATNVNNGLRFTNGIPLEQFLKAYKS